MVGWTLFPGRSPSNYNLLCCTKIWLSKILTGQEFVFQISLPDILPKLNTFDLSLVINTEISKCTIFALELYSLILPNSLIKFKYDLKIQITGLQYFTNIKSNNFIQLLAVAMGYWFCNIIIYRGD